MAKVLDVSHEWERQVLLEEECAGDAEQRREIGRFLATNYARDINLDEQAIEQF